jgi:hypothetical protein
VTSWSSRGLLFSGPVGMCYMNLHSLSCSALLLAFSELRRSGIGPGSGSACDVMLWLLGLPRPIPSSSFPLPCIASRISISVSFSLFAYLQVFISLFLFFYPISPPFFGTSAILFMEDLRPPVLYPAGRLWSHVSSTAFAYRHFTR